MHVSNDIHYFSSHARDAPLQVLETFLFLGSRKINFLSYFIQSSHQVIMSLRDFPIQRNSFNKWQRAFSSP